MTRAGRVIRHPGLGAVSGAVLAYLAFGGWMGALVGVASAAGLYRWLARMAAVSRPAPHLALAAADLPFVADLLAEALRSGVPVDRAVGVVGDAIRDSLGDRLLRVSRALALGALPTEAWSHLGDIPGADGLARAAVRSADSGAALAAAFHRVAEELRTERLVAAEADAHRLSTLIVLPLGLCFLPAFLLTGVVPVVLATLARVLQ